MCQLIATITGLACLMCYSSPKANWQEVERNGMHVRWRIEGSNLRVEMQAPTQGWLAIGFNPKAGLSQTQLLMGRVKAGKVELLEHWVVSPGDYRPVTALGGETTVRNLSGEEGSTGTRIRFTIPLAAADSFHHSLSPGQRLHLLLAYSASDDFQHHSRMRTECTIHL